MSDTAAADVRHASGQRWIVLGAGLAAQAASCVFLYGLPVLVPTLRRSGAIEHHGLTLGAVGVLVAGPSVGLLLTLILWGAAADRFGERIVIGTGLALATAALTLAATVHGFVALLLILAVAGAAGASVNAASGRMVIGWFAADQRGLAMGIRQTGQPLGVALAAGILPPVAARWGVNGAFVAMALLCAAATAAVVLLAVDPPRPAVVVGAPRAISPYRDGVLWRIHAASAALVVPQFAVSAFTLAYLVSERDWSPVAAGRLIVAFQVAGAAGRIAAGVWSDRVDSRLRPMRTLAVASAALMVSLAVGDLAHSAVILGVFGLAAIITVADNGLAFTAVAELAGTHWAGRALGVQNTGQNLSAALTPPVLGAVVGVFGYGAGFALAAVFPVLAIGLIPVGRAARASDLRRSAA